MAAKHDFYKSVLDSLSIGVYCVDSLRKIIYWNDAAEKISGFTQAEVLGSCCSNNILMHIDDDGTEFCNHKCPIAQTLANGQPYQEDVYLHHKEGYRLPIKIQVTPIFDEDKNIVGACQVFSDATCKVHYVNEIQQLQKMAMLDALTEIGNRRYGEVNLHSRLDKFKQCNCSSLGIVMFDIDHFKKVNDAFGHDVGDRVLKMVAKTLKNNVKPSDIVCRWGGEEFVVILDDVNAGDLVAIAERLRTLIKKSFIVHDAKTIKVTISGGATIAQTGDTVDSLLKRADQLLYHGKESGRDCIAIT